MIKLSFIIPCYGSELTIQDVVNEIRQTVTSREGYDYEIILVNDNSPDNVYGVIASLAKNDVNILGIDLANNFGQHSAILTGMRYAKGDIVFCLDDDGQTPPSELFKLKDKLDEGFDVVIAKYIQKKHSLCRNFGSRLNDYMSRVLIGKPKELSIMSYFCCKRFVTKEIIKYENPYPYIQGLLLRTTKNITNVYVEHKDRIAGKSGYSFMKLFALWINGFTAFSVKPLRAATFIGVFSSVLAVFLAIYIIINKIFINPNVPLGYSSIMTALIFFGGLIMMVLGLIGEYVGRIYISINNAPQAVIRRTTDDKE